MDIRAYAFLAGYMNKDAAEPPKRWSLDQIKSFLSKENFPWENILQAGKDQVPFLGAASTAHDLASEAKHGKQFEQDMLKMMREDDKMEREHGYGRPGPVDKASHYENKIKQSQSLAAKPSLGPEAPGEWPTKKPNTPILSRYLPKQFPKPAQPNK
jgi:hypothetical protein